LRLAGVLTDENLLDHRSYERQGIEKVPTVHLGVAAMQMERRGIRTDRGNVNRAIEIGNRELGHLKARIKKLQKWLDDEKENAPLSLADVLSEMLNGHDRSHWQQIRDLKMAAKTLVFIQENKLATIEDVRGKVSDFYGEQQAINAKMKPVDRRLKTLNEHLCHSENFTKHRKIIEKRNTLYTAYKQLDSQGIFSILKAKKLLKSPKTMTGNTITLCMITMTLRNICGMFCRNGLTRR
jgi:chromosome segregation ATPase